ncbi:lipid-A-disaccharide synthase [Amylibacter marinus]|uniref:Lipid-A-disaccharide synthase n=1 Tax=Amylibacter marinus TaxID=1475483 RepID=A0ABQ5VS35_9RHOB|nr:lipid-A-disaccharide synthase [Amylibacter marinus]GLQ34227.1 lipid-A-disaccharide synthase [Amylibacter marinus]
MTLSFFCIAGELSGDRLGAALIEGLRLETKGRVEFSGIGGPMMAAAGMDSLFDMNELSVMGLVEVLPRVPRLLYRVRQTARAVIAARPDALITIDSPDFCLRVAKLVRAELPDIKVIHYVAPSVWAWRPERAEKMARYVDHVLALLPFEPPLMRAAGMTCDFVGHPVVSEAPVLRRDQAGLIADFALDERKPIVTLLPGSRRGEIARMGPIFDEVTAGIRKSHPDAQFILPVAPSVADMVERATARWAVRPHLLENSADTAQSEARKRAAYGLSDLALATSGTVALELAAQNCPMVVAYRANWATTRMVKKLAQIDTANLINIITETRVVPEFLFENCHAEQILPACLAELSQASEGSDQSRALAGAMLALGQGAEDAHLWAARSVLGAIG